MNSTDTTIKEDFEQKLLGSLNLFAMDIDLHGYGVENHTAFTKRIMEDFSQALTQREDEVRKEIEGMKKKDPNNLAGDPGKWETTIAGYNQAISDILLRLSEGGARK